MTGIIDPPIRDAIGDLDVRGAADVILKSLWNTTVPTWAIIGSDPHDPDPERLETCRRLYQIEAWYLQTFGQILITEKRDGVVAWLPPARRPDASLRERLAGVVTKAAADRLDDIEHRCARRRPQEPHHRLTYLAVGPKGRDDNLGAALLRAYHDRIDADRGLSHVEVADPRVVQLFARNGYVAAEPFRVPDGGPTLWPMTRRPRP